MHTTNNRLNGSIASPPKKHRQSPKKKSKHFKQIDAQERWLILLGAYSIAAVIVGILLVSLSHLAEGIAKATGSPAWQSWLIAIAADCGMIAAEIALLLSHEHRLEQQIKSFCERVMLGTVIFSIGLNCMAFLAHCEPTCLGRGLAVGLGFALPAMVFHLSKISGHMFLARCPQSRKQPS